MLLKSKTKTTLTFWLPGQLPLPPSFEQSIYNRIPFLAKIDILKHTMSVTLHGDRTVPGFIDIIAF